MLNYTITDLDHCRSLESFLRRLLPGASAGYLQKLVKSGAVTVNGTKTARMEILALADQVAVKESERTRQLLGAPQLPVDILYENDQLLILNKPAGLAMHRTAEITEPTLVDQAQDLMRLRGLDTNPRPVNRLDRGTSGAVFLAKGATAAGMFGRQLKEEGFNKLYLALASGTLPAAGSFAAPIDDKDALTRYENLAHGAGLSLLLLAPITGRTHQIRRHLADAGHPVLGDKRYRGVPLPDETGFCLHSFRTCTTLPGTEQTVCISAPLPSLFLTRLNLVARESLPALLATLHQIAGHGRPSLAGAA